MQTGAEIERHVVGPNDEMFEVMQSSAPRQPNVRHTRGALQGRTKPGQAKPSLTEGSLAPARHHLLELRERDAPLTVAIHRAQQRCYIRPQRGACQSAEASSPDPGIINPEQLC